MSLWASIQAVPDRKYEMKSFYDRKGIYDIRVKYGAWIEERLELKKSYIFEEEAMLFCNDLREYLQSTEDSHAFSFVTKRMEYISELDFYNHLMEGVAKEVLFLAQLSPSNEISQLDLVRSLIKSCDEFYQIPNLNIDTDINSADSNDLSPVSYLSKIFHGYDVTQRNVLLELKNWQRQQIRICNIDESPKESSNQLQRNDHIEKLNQIQLCVELLVELTFRLLQLIDSVKHRRMTNHISPDQRLDQLGQEIRIKQEILLNDSFIVVIQPSQVIKTNTNFTALVRWLIGPQLGLNNITNVKCIVVPEEQARRLNKGVTFNQANTALNKITGNEVKMEYQEQTRNYSALFKALQIKKIQRSERRGSNESVMDEKLALLFQMTAKINNSAFTVSTISAPVVVIVHGNQEHQACATIMWDNAFSEIGRDLFVVPDSVPWDRLAEALHFKCFSETKKGLTDANRNSLYEKLFPCNEINPRAEISWTKFCKDEMTGFNFTFWEWFHHTIKLIKERLLGPWNADLIEGFISKTATTTKLQSQPPGTFVIRFSDSVKGAVTISYVHAPGVVDHISPWTSRCLQNRCLADRIRDIQEIDRLYPYGLPKSSLFDRFCTVDDQKASTAGYVPSVPITTILRNPTTPPTNSSVSDGNALQNGTPSPTSSPNSVIQIVTQPQLLADEEMPFVFSSKTVNARNPSTSIYNNSISVNFSSDNLPSSSNSPILVEIVNQPHFLSENDMAIESDPTMDCIYFDLERYLNKD